LKKNKLNWRINEQIRVPKVRVIASDGKQIGVVDIKKALSLAKKEGLDLVEIAPFAKPPVTKIVDLGKFRYQEEKKERTLKKKTKSPGVKEIRFSPFIGEADYQTRLARIRGFLKEKNKIRVVVKFKGRQMGSKQFGYKLLDKLLKDLGDSVLVDMEGKFLGRHLVMVISPIAGGKKKEEKENAKTKN